MSRKAMNTNVSVSVLSRTDKQQIDSFVVKPRNHWQVKFGSSCVLGPDHPESHKLNAYLLYYYKIFISTLNVFAHQVNWNLLSDLLS